MVVASPVRGPDGAVTHLRAGMNTPPCPHAGGPLRARELLTGVGRRA